MRFRTREARREYAADTLRRVEFAEARLRIVEAERDEALRLVAAGIRVKLNLGAGTKGRRTTNIDPELLRKYTA